MKEFPLLNSRSRVIGSIVLEEATSEILARETITDLRLSYSLYPGEPRHIGEFALILPMRIPTPSAGDDSPKEGLPDRVEMKDEKSQGLVKFGEFLGTVVVAFFALALVAIAILMVVGTFMLLF